MKRNNIRWKSAFGGALVAEIGQIAAAVLWVVIYSYLIYPGGTPAYYQQYAMLSGPWVSIFAGMPIFYLASHGFARNRPTAMGLFGIFFVFDATILILAGESPSLALWQVVASYVTKFVACYMGGNRPGSIEVEAR